MRISCNIENHNIPVGFLEDFPVLQINLIIAVYKLSTKYSFSRCIIFCHLGTNFGNLCAKFVQNNIEKKIYQHFILKMKTTN